MLYNSIIETIGNTPLLRLSSIEKCRGSKAAVYGKLEAMNPAGSIKDRASLSMILDAEEKGILKPGGTIIEPPAEIRASVLPPLRQREATGQSLFCRKV